MQKKVDTVYLDARDNICVAARDLTAGHNLEIAGQNITLQQDIRIGHKIAVAEITNDSSVFKYGQPIGKNDRGYISWAMGFIFTICGTTPQKVTMKRQHNTPLLVNL